ncbi:hypothetical protein C1H76_8997 [Elsinoe australis]|uniref:Uncharacterized protein n=1 Tax=Elsinoe australis TaxID=40998 RepID=A0A4U7AQR9_9PEZI|nr:hypothetical protein C1H76_8997 [Elsinoe australis]
MRPTSVGIETTSEHLERAATPQSSTPNGSSFTTQQADYILPRSTASEDHRGPSQSDLSRWPEATAPDLVDQQDDLTIPSLDAQMDPSLHLGYDTSMFEASPNSSFDPSVTAEAATLWWINVLAGDASEHDFESHLDSVPHIADSGRLQSISEHQDGMQQDAGHDKDDPDRITLTHHETELLRHFVTQTSSLIDMTDPDRHFAIQVSQMALKNRGLLTAILALSARHLCLRQGDMPGTHHLTSDRTTSVKYYHETLQYLRREMSNANFLRSDELLATVLAISTYEMIDGYGQGWERHLKGVFWIQFSQRIHGESTGLKARIWWA